MKFRPIGTDLFHSDGRTERDMTQLMTAFRNFMKAPRNSRSGTPRLWQGMYE